MIDWTNISYLKEGNLIQQKSYTILTEIEIMEYLSPYCPLLAGTIPIDIDVEESDLDIICEASHLVEFRKIVVEKFGTYPHFKDDLNTKRYVASFIYKDIPIEIFAQNIPSTEQAAFRHMLIEYRILYLLGNESKNQIRDLKQQGYKTEPAFGKLLSLEEPYSDLLELEKLDDCQLKEYLNNRLLK